MLLATIMSVLNAENAGLLNVPEPTAFNDQSALNVKSNLQSKQYQDFIRTLYHLDKDNLARADDLFAHPEKVDQQRQDQSDEAQQPSYADYIKSQPNNYFGISIESTKRYIRSAQGAIFRPLFVYRTFQERTLQREEERRRRRIANRRRNPYLYH